MDNMKQILDDMYKVKYMPHILMEDKKLQYSVDELGQLYLGNNIGLADTNKIQKYSFIPNLSNAKVYKARTEKILSPSDHRQADMKSQQTLNRFIQQLNYRCLLQPFQDNLEHFIKRSPIK